MKQTLRIIFASALATAALIKAVPALAETAPVNVSIVSTADLDLSSDAGRRALEARLAVAAREVCGTASDVDLHGKNEVRKCRREVLARTAAQRDQLLAAAGRGGTVAIAGSR